MENIIIHIDVNNAFLSWTAVDLLKSGYKIDIRNIEAIIGGDESKRHGIVLAKSMVAKSHSKIVILLQLIRVGTIIPLTYCI